MPKAKKPITRRVKKFTALQTEIIEVFLGEGGRSVNKTARILKRDPGNMSKMLRHPMVQEHIRKVQQEALLRDDTIAKIDEIQRVWSEVLRDTEEETKERLKAGELLAKCRGEFAPEKVAADLHLHVFTPEQDEALEEWLLIREDPRIKILIAEIRREREGLHG